MEPKTYPESVPSWIDTDQEDIEAAKRFYGGLFGWTFADATPPDARSRYVVAQLGGQDVAGLSGPAEQAAGGAPAPGGSPDESRPTGTPTSLSTMPTPQPHASRPPAGASCSLPRTRARAVASPCASTRRGCSSASGRRGVAWAPRS